MALETGNGNPAEVAEKEQQMWSLVGLGSTFLTSRGEWEPAGRTSLYPCLPLLHHGHYSWAASQPHPPFSPLHLGIVHLSATSTSPKGFPPRHRTARVGSPHCREAVWYVPDAHHSSAFPPIPKAWSIRT